MILLFTVFVRAYKGMQSAYTIRVSERQSDGVRDVAVLHHGELHFSTSHRNMKWAFLTRFPAPSTQHGGSSLSAEDSLPGDRCDDTAGFRDDDKLQDQTHVGRDYGASRERVMHEYLCVFHLEEPRNCLSNYTAHQLCTICSAYSTVDPGAVTHFVLNNINPSCVVPATRGVFVHGMPQASVSPFP
ncbi:unnamed protein product, partial [Trypanosoma congolense IL3000]